MRRRLFKIWMKLVHNNPEAEAQSRYAQENYNGVCSIRRARRLRESPRITNETICTTLLP